MKFVLSNEAYRNNIKVMDRLTQEQKAIARKAGTDNPHFEAAWTKLFKLISNKEFHLFEIKNRFDIRALAIALTAKKELRAEIKIGQEILDDVVRVLPIGSNLFIESLTQFFLSDFDSISDHDLVGRWLCKERERKGLNIGVESKILCSDGPTYVAKQAIQRETTFELQVKAFKLDNYAAGDFIKRAKSVYFVEQLQKIPANQPHDLLEEVSKEHVAQSRYDAEDLVGHVALRIIIDRAPAQGVHETWQNAVIAIAGDPRVPTSSPRFIKWWSQLSQQQIKKVQGWLSKLDLKLFLEALEDYSKSIGDGDMMRMFPSRKHFLEGLHEAEAIVHTKLYLSRKAHSYIQKNYRPEHVPDYSIVDDGDRSIIYAELTHGHMVEGSHNCQIWFYQRLHSSAPVTQFGVQLKKYRDLTTGLNMQMYKHGCEAYAHFTHSPMNFNWQKKSIETLKSMGVNIRASDVLSDEDYMQYKHLYGVG